MSQASPDTKHKSDNRVKMTSLKSESDSIEPGAGTPETDSNPAEAIADSQPKEIGGRDGPEPTRFGDWEKAGRCIDF